jgi:ATP-dependent Clp protease adapter protein ClpS
MTMTPEKIKETSNTGTGGGDWNVILWNNEYNTFDEVIMGLVSVIGLSPPQAAGKAQEIHTKGKAIVKTAPQEHAEMYKDQLESAIPGVSVTIEKV